MIFPYSPLKFLYNNNGTDWHFTYSVKWNGEIYFIGKFSQLDDLCYITRVRPEAISMIGEERLTEEIFEIITPGISGVGVISLELFSIDYNCNLYFKDDTCIYKFDGSNIELVKDFTSAIELQDFLIKDDVFYVVYYDSFNIYLTTQISGTDEWNTYTAWTSTEELYTSNYDSVRLVEVNDDVYIWAKMDNNDDNYHHHLIINASRSFNVILNHRFIPNYLLNNDWYDYVTNYQLDFRNFVCVLDNKLYMCLDNKLYMISKNRSNEDVVEYVSYTDSWILSGLFTYNNKLFVQIMDTDYSVTLASINTTNYTMKNYFTFSGNLYDVYNIEHLICIYGTGIYIYNEIEDEFYFRNLSDFGITNNINRVFDYYYINNTHCFGLTDMIPDSSLYNYSLYSGFNYITNTNDLPCQTSTETNFYFRRDTVVPVSKQLLLAVDDSGSIDDTENNLQFSGYVNAFKEISPYINTDNILTVCMVLWSSYDEQSVVIPWTLLYDEISTNNFVTQIENLERLYNGNTAVISAIFYANEIIQSSEYQGDKRIIDISSDGDDNDSPTGILNLRPSEEDIYINAITIEEETGSNYIYNWYRDNIIQGPDKFIIGVEDFTAFSDAMILKIKQELDIEEPEEIDDTEIVDVISVSPLVNVKEIDFSAIAIAKGKIGVIILRNTYKGPEKERVFITNENELTDMFGRPTNNTYCIQDMLSAIAYLRDSDKLYCTRVMSSNSTFAGIFCAQSGICTGFDSTNAPVLDIDIFNPDRYHEEIENFDSSILMNIISINRGEFGNNLRIAIVDKNTYNEIKLRQHSDYQIYNDVFKIDSPLFDEKNFLLIVQERNIIANTWSTVEVHNVSTDENAVDDTQGKLFVESKVNMYSKYIRVAWNRLFLNTNMTDHYTTSYKKLTGGSNGTGDVADATIFTALDLYENPEEIDVNFFIDSNKSLPVKSYMIDICESRKDCIVVLDVPKELVVHNIGSEFEDLIEWRVNTFNESSSYAALYASWLKVKNKFRKNEIWMPSSGYVAGIYSRSDNLSEPWYAPAGRNRAVLKEVERLSWFPHIEKRDELYRHGINSIITFANIGHVVFGQKNLLDKDSAFNRVNIRRLFITMEKAISTTAANFLFEPNNEITRMVFNNQIETFLRDVKEKDGIESFFIVSNEANNTPERIERNEMWFDIFIKPIHMTEYIVLEFVVTKQDVKFTEIANILEPEEYKYIKEG